MDDFEPAKVAAQIGPLKELLDAREKLNQLLNKMEGNDKLEETLRDIMTNTEKAMALAKAAGVEAPAAPTEDTTNG
jgi:type VI secretion system protein ImpB